MIKVALLGAPSSDKTGVALTVQAALKDRKVTICDDYVSDIEQRSDNTLGHFASYLGNLQLAIGRWEYERQLVRDHKPDILITCGTIVETTVYEAVNALTDAAITTDGGSLTLRTLQNNKRASVTMTMLGIITYDTWDYDFAYYLPVDDDADSAAKVVDQHIVEAADALGVQVKKVGQGRDDLLDAVPTIVQDITAYEQAEIAASD